jgi:CubicO group peptidase (beta-lactamase class C family)
MDAQRVRGVLVLHHGTIRLERYAPPHGPATRWNSFSVAKSITSTLVGAAMKDGHIKSLDDDVTRYISALRGSAYEGVTVRQLLTMTSGVTWNEDYTDVNSDVARMYAQPAEPGFDMTVSYVRKLPREAQPGTKWVYKTAETNLVGVLVAEATGKPLADYLSEKIWRAYGMERDAEWMIDDVGHEQGGCCLAVTLRDSGRFGQFILDGARVEGKPIVPDNWLAEATRNQVATGTGSGYGYQWWPRDNGTFEGRGIYGQTLHIDPARRLVVVINSATEQPTGRASGEARQAFLAAIKAELDAEKRQAKAHSRRFWQRPRPWAATRVRRPRLWLPPLERARVDDAAVLVDGLEMHLVAGDLYEHERVPLVVSLRGQRGPLDVAAAQLG